MTTRHAEITGALSLVLVLLATGCSGFQKDWARVPCDELSVNSEQWSDADAEESTDIAAALIRCDTLVGKSAGEIQRMFGADRKFRKFYLGNVNDVIGPGDAQFFTIRYDDNNRVVWARLSAPPS
jgi:hypothetical protein